MGPPGWVLTNRLPLDVAPPGKLKAFAVLALAAAITRLPGNCEPRSAPEKATAHTTPSRFTTAPHISLPEPPFLSPCTTVFSASPSAATLGKPAQTRFTAEGSTPDSCACAFFTESQLATR